MVAGLWFPVVVPGSVIEAPLEVDPMPRRVAGALLMLSVKVVPGATDPAGRSKDQRWTRSACNIELAKSQRTAIVDLSRLNPIIIVSQA